jgi:hypothetical protein
MCSANIYIDRIIGKISQYNITCKYSEQINSSLPHHARNLIPRNPIFARDTGEEANVNFGTLLSRATE